MQGRVQKFFGVGEEGCKTLKTASKMRLYAMLLLFYVSDNLFWGEEGLIPDIPFPWRWPQVQKKISEGTEAYFVPP